MEHKNLTDRHKYFIAIRNSLSHHNEINGRLTVDLTKIGHKILYQRGAQCHQSLKTQRLPPLTRLKKWDSAEQAKFKRLVREGKIDPERNDKAYIEKICAKEWGDWKLVQQKTNRARKTAACFFLLMVLLP